MVSRVEGPPDDWTPRTDLGKQVLRRDISSMAEIISRNDVIQEPEIITLLLPNLEYEVLEVRYVQKQTDAGRKPSFRSAVVVGNRDGWVGVATGKAKQVHMSIEKAVDQALLKIAPVRRGCGSWECMCGTDHSLRTKSEGKWSSVRVEILPGPRGLGVVAGETAKMVAELAGVRDCWIVSSGETRTAVSFAMATYDALRNSYKLITKDLWVR
jgi:small subunit ribosomal protein S5